MAASATTATTPATDGEGLEDGADGVDGLDATSPPRHLAPMLATPGRLPAKPDGWAFEFKWDGIRAVVHWDGRSVRLDSRRLRDMTATYPELQSIDEQLTERLDGQPVILDGEIVAFDEGGRPSFQLLQERMNVAHTAAATRRADRVPVALLLFDVLHVGDRSLLHVPYVERRGLLDELALAGSCWATPMAYPGEADATFAAAEAQGLEGVIAKRLDSAYRPGARSPAWVKVKLALRDEFVVGGWSPGERGREGRIGSLLVGRYDADGRLRYCGGVGTGFTDATLRRLGEMLAPLRRDTSPFAEGNVKKGAVYVDPALVAEVEYRERTRDGILRQPSFKGLRTDKDPTEVVG